MHIVLVGGVLVHRGSKAACIEYVCAQSWRAETITIAKIVTQKPAGMKVALSTSDRKELERLALDIPQV